MTGIWRVFTQYVDEQREDARKRWRRQDFWLFGLALVVTLEGCFWIFSVKYQSAIEAGNGFIPPDFVKQVGFTLASLLVYVLVVRYFEVRSFKRSAAFWGALSLALLALVLIVGREINGAKRWLGNDSFGFQPSEFAKVALVCYLAGVLADRKPKASGFGDAVRRLWPLIPVIVGLGLVEGGKDLGTAFVLVFIGFWVGVCGGASVRSIVLFLLVGGLVFAFVMIKEPYRVERFTKHYQMWDPQNANGVGKQPTDSATSIALAGPMGVGPGNGIAKTRIKTGEETDFVMTTIEEEGGLLGGFSVWGPLTAIVARLLWIASLVRDRYAQLVLLGCAVWIGVQTAVNMMVANAVLPTVGIPCPFVSAGGSSLVALWIAIAICQTANRREPKRVA